MAYKPKHLAKRSAVWPVRLLSLASILFACVLMLGMGMVIFNALRSRGDQAAFRELAALVEAQTLPREEAPAPAQAGEAEPTGPQKSPYQILYEENQDFVAWVRVPGTKIDYPVMHTPQDIEHYIYRAFDGSHSPSGTPFVGDHGDLSSRKCIIYGHNMGDGTMFHDLLEYLDKDFWQENPTFTLTTLEETREYEIFAAVQTRMLLTGERGLRFYRLEEGVEEWMRTRSLYDTGIVPGEEDGIVILSTCSYHTEEGRFLIAGRRIR